MRQGLRAGSLVVVVAATCGLWATGCKSGKASLAWGGKEMDARLLADVYTWGCQQSEVDKNGDETGEYVTWSGVFAQIVTLEFAPDALRAVELPSPGGCTADLDLFPTDAGSGGEDIPDLSDNPRWETDVDSGELVSLSPGFWKDDVFEDFNSCYYVEDILSGGTRLTNADILDGVSTPEPAEAPEVTFSGMSSDPDTGVEYIDWGDEVTASWDDHAWDEVWVQVRRERTGEDVAWESITCNATGDGSFTLDATIWSFLDEDLEVDRNNIYVGFQKSDTVETDDGVKVETISRSMALAVVVD